MIPIDNLPEFSAIVDHAIRALRLDDSWLARVVVALSDERAPRPLDWPVTRVAPFITEAAGDSPGLRPLASAAVVAHLVRILPERVSRMNLPFSIIELIPARIARLKAFLTSADLTGYGPGDDSFLKDLRIAGGFSVACVAQDVDLDGTVRRAAGLKSIVMHSDIANGWRLARVGGSTWFVIHTDSRYTETFSEAGFSDCYRRVADLLACRPSVRGMVGTSWFFDPKLLAISPRHGHLLAPTAHGAFLVRHGSSNLDMKQALATSASRRAAYDRGDYTPTSYSLVWPRGALISWSRSCGV